MKSTKSTTPLTWKRAKIANSAALIQAFETSTDDAQKLGDAIITLCNDHVQHSIKKFNLQEIGYARLIMFTDGTAIYFERLLCTNGKSELFTKSDYSWKWSTQKITTKKEQLSALHGTNIKTKKKAFAWHGRGENQLHFIGEKEWRPKILMPAKIGEINFSDDYHAVAFKLPTNKVDWDGLTKFLNDKS